LLLKSRAYYRIIRVHKRSDDPTLSSRVIGKNFNCAPLRATGRWAH
jgi:hypothetical protein